jgi:hypothetical protein
VSSDDDDLTPWQDEPVLRALTGPGSDDELAGEAEALAAFRAAVPVRSRRRLARRLGVGGSTVAVAIVFSGGVAAAYTASLPTSVQRFAHEATTWLGAIKVPAPTAHKAKQAGGQHVASAVTAAPTPASTIPASVPTSSPAPKRSVATHHQAKPAHRAHTSPSPSASVTPPPVTTPTPTPTPTPTESSTPVPGSVTISLSGTTVSVGGDVTVYGHLATSAGEPIAGQQVWLLERTADQPGPMQVASGSTGADGSVTLTSPPLSHTARLRLVTGTKARSAAIAVVVRPTISATVTPQGASTSIRVNTNGADPGDTVAIEIRAASGWQDVAANQVDSSGGATFGVSTPSRRADRYRAILTRTKGHGSAVTRFRVPPQH